MPALYVAATGTTPHTATAVVNLICAKRRHRHYSGHLALQRGTTVHANTSITRACRAAQLLIAGNRRHRGTTTLHVISTICARVALRTTPSGAVRTRRLLHSEGTYLPLRRYRVRGFLRGIVYLSSKKLLFLNRRQEPRTSRKKTAT